LGLIETVVEAVEVDGFVDDVEAEAAVVTVAAALAAVAAAVVAAVLAAVVAVVVAALAAAVDCGGLTSF